MILFTKRILIILSSLFILQISAWAQSGSGGGSDGGGGDDCIYGCTDPGACNYDPGATCDNGSCEANRGCTDPSACNYNPDADCDDGSCAESNPDGTLYYTDPICTADNGELEVDMTSGTPPYTYDWSIGGDPSSNIIDDLPPGEYGITVYDANNCKAIGSYDLTSDNIPLVPMNAEDVSCNGALDGYVEVTEIYGPSANIWSDYDFEWSNGSTDDWTGDVGADTYTVNITDQNGCTGQGSGTVSQPAAIVVTPQVTSSCFDEKDGSIALTVTGGDEDYSYSWTPAGPDDPENTDLAPGNYSVIVTDGNDCMGTSSAVVAEYPATTPTITASGPTTFCADDYITLDAGAGYDSYLWGPTDDITASTELISVASSDEYSVTVTDANGCTGVASIEVTVNPNPQPTITADGPTKFCAGTDGSVELDAGDYESWSWSPGDETTESITVNPSSSTVYYVTVTDENDCTGTAAQPVTVNLNPTANAGAGSSFCASPPGGYANLGGSPTASGGDGTYSYSWEPAEGLNSTAVAYPIASPTETTDYSVTVTDGNGCTASAEVTVTVNDNPEATAEATDETCYESGNGTVTVTVEPESDDYTYDWSPVGSDAESTGLPANDYTIIVTDANGCTASASATVSSPEAITLSSYSSFAATCNTSKTWLTVTFTGGTGDLDYLWSDGNTYPITVSESGDTISNLQPGINYWVSVTDENNCTASEAWSYTQPPPYHTNFSASICSGGSYEFNGQTYTTPGAYPATLTAQNGCDSTVTLNLTVNPIVSPSVSISPGTSTTCTGSSVTFTATPANGGASPSYQWFKNGNSVGNNSATYSDNGLNNQDSVWVVMTSNATCISTATATSKKDTITVNADVTFTTSHTNESCNGGSTGSITITASGGNGSYTYSDNGGSSYQLPNVFSNLSANTYTIEVKDGNGCTATTSNVTITSAPAIAVTVTGPTTFCANSNAVLTAAAGFLSYAWSNGATKQSITVDKSGSYMVTVTSAPGCSATSTPVVVKVNALPAADITANGSTILCTGASVKLTSSAGASYKWSTGATTSSITVFTRGSYTVTVTSAAGCSAVSAPEVITVNPPRGSLVTVEGSTTFCTGNSVKLNAISGAAYKWSTGAITEAITIHASGSYDVTVTGNGNCQWVSTPVVVTVDSCHTRTDEIGNSNGADTGVFVNHSNEFSVLAYPNPFTDRIHLSISGGGTELSDVFIYDITGQIIFEGKSVTDEEDINAGNNLASGIYLVKVSKGGMNKIIRMVKTE